MMEQLETVRITCCKSYMARTHFQLNTYKSIKFRKLSFPKLTLEPKWGGIEKYLNKNINAMKQK
jgi:hypothetical protein